VKKFLVVLFWAFLFRHPIEFPGASAVTVVGPFPTEATCKAHYEEAHDALGALPGVIFIVCTERKDA
jgi:hypothetical protein